MQRVGFEAQVELVRASGLTPPQISRYLSAQEMPGQTNLRALCKGLGIDRRMFWSPIDELGDG